MWGAKHMATIKINMEANLDDQVIAKFVEMLSKADRPPERIDISLSNISGTITIRTVYKEGETKQ